MLTSDPNDERLKTGQLNSTGQHEIYLVLSEEERKKGFVRPYRDAYIHVGIAAPQNVLRELTADEHERYDKYNYIKYEEYSEDYSKEHGHVLGRFWTQEELNKIDKGCQSLTKMGRALSETYQRDPKFYGSTFCIACDKHLPVREFVWDADGTRVGS